MVIGTGDREVIALTEPSWPHQPARDGALRRLAETYALARRRAPEIDAALIEQRVSSMNRAGGTWIVANVRARHAMR